MVGEQVWHAPQGAQAERALLASDAIVGLVDVVSIYEVLGWVHRESLELNRILVGTYIRR